MNLKVLTTAKEKSRGVLGLKGLEAEDVFFFSGIGEGEAFHMIGVPFPLDIAFLDRGFKILAIRRMEPQSGGAVAPIRCAHAAEAAAGYFESRGLAEGGFWTELQNALKS
jgi:uncharacterized membrane protein (UPF0127 family)